VLLLLELDPESLHLHLDHLLQLLPQLQIRLLHLSQLALEHIDLRFLILLSGCNFTAFFLQGALCLIKLFLELLYFPQHLTSRLLLARQITLYLLLFNPQCIKLRLEF